MSAIRILPPYERRLLSDHLNRLDREDLHLRFGGYLSPSAVERYVDNLSWMSGVVLVWEVDGEVRGCGELVNDRTVLPSAAEFAVTIEHAWQGQGAGLALMHAALLVARNRGLRRVHLLCLAENPRMMRLARACGAKLTWEEGEILGEIELPPANPLSLAQEGVQLLGGMAAHSLHDVRRSAAKTARQSFGDWALRGA